MEDKKYCIYRHLKPNGEVFYIGIGLKNRPCCKHNRNKYWKNIVSKYGYEVQILKTNLTQEEACELEIMLISWYGRRDLNTGTLCNLTDGGEKGSGYIYTDELKEKMSLIAKSKNRKTSLEMKKYLSELNTRSKHPQSKKVIDIETGYIWDCAKDCAEELNIVYKNLSRWLTNVRPNKTTLRYLNNEK